jgi:gamma-glutamyltranspeptidase
MLLCVCVGVKQPFFPSFKVCVIVSGYDFTSDSVSTTEKTVLTYHRIAEAMKFAYALRSELGDSKFVDISQVSLKPLKLIKVG